MKTTPETLWQTYLSLKENQPNLRIRDAANQLNISEAELVAADPQSVQLACEDWQEFLRSIYTLGRVMTITRNDACVHEKKGRYEPVSFEGNGHVGLVLDKGIDLRLFMGSWTHLFAVIHPKKDGSTQRSLQIFDGCGTAIHKIFLTADSDIAAFDAIVAERKTDKIAMLVDPKPAAKPEQPDDSIDSAGLQEGWLALKDVHDFHGLMRKFGVSRQQAFRLAPAGHAWTINKDALDTLFQRASETETPIMVFVGNRGCIQIHTGAIKRVERMGPWLNVLDPDFNLHLRTDLVQEVWVVKKPGDCGDLTSIEAFDASGESVMTLFGERKPGKPELASWVRLVNELGVEDESVA